MTQETPPVDESVDSGFAPPELPDFDTEPGQEPDEEPRPAPPTPDELPRTELTDAEREQFRSVLTIGKRTKKVVLFDHAFVLRSLMCDDELRIAMVVNEYKDTTGFSRAYQCASVAAAILSVDGESWENSLAAVPDPDALFRDKYERTVRLHPLVVSKLYSECLTIESEFADLVAKLGKL